MSAFAEFKLYKNLAEILVDLSKYENLQPVQQLLQVFQNAKTKAAAEKRTLKYPLVIFEGLDGSGKTSMSREVAKKVKAEKWMTPPQSIRSLRDYFDTSPLRTAYYSLGNYIAALEVSCILPEKPVIMDRFWHSTTAYNLAQSVADKPGELTMPSASDEVYKWPEDLLKPNRVIFLNVSEAERLQRHSRRNTELVTTQEILLKDNNKFREDVIKAFQNMREPKVEIFNGDGTFTETLNLLTINIRSLLDNC